MANIKGKYQITESKNFYELLLKIGVPEEHAKKASDERSIFDVEVDGNTVRITNDTNGQKTVSELVVNEEVDEKFSSGVVAKSTTTLNGNILSVNSKTSDTIIKRVYTFSAAGAEEHQIVNKGDIKAEATRFFKRL